ncbi:MAG TPA: GAF domain-containing protein, partial [Mariprofundaceae bacterium]|nr:GAF domain-containing protein [Mariprofundaceae bacterium]
AGMHSKGSFNLEYRIRDAQGNWRWLNDRSIDIREASGDTIVTGLAVDITEQKMHEMLLQARLRLADMAPRLDHRQLMQATLDLAEELTGSDIGFFHFVDEDQETIMLQAWSSHTVEAMCTAEGAGVHYPVSQAGVWADAIRSRKPVIHEDYASLPDRKGMPEGHAAVSRLATVPILRNDKVVAAIGIGNKPQPYDDQDVDFLTQLADLAWDTIDVKKAEIALAHANRALVTLGTVNRELVHATDEVKLMQSVCTAIVEQRGYRMAWVGYARDNADKDIELMASAGVPQGLMDEIRPGWGDDARAVGPTGRAIRTGKTQIARDIAREPPHDWKDAMLGAGCASDIALPLKDETGAVFGLLHVYAEEVDAFTDNEIRLLEEMAGDLAFGVNVLRVRLERDDALRLNEQHLAQMRLNLDETVVAISKAVEARDPYTAGHQRRVAELAVAIGRKMGLDEDALQGIHLGATIHDIGKINIPAEILSKPSRLNEMEMLMVREHPKVGFNILKDIHFPWPVAEVAYQHHERIDGSGYPQGLKGSQICLEARIVAVADVMEAMSSHRPYRTGLGHEAAAAEISGNRGRFYDVDAVDACLAVYAGGFRFG